MIAQIIRICIVLPVVFGLHAKAEIIKLPSQPPHVVTSDAAPSRGMTKNEVESSFGAPQTMIGPIGEPAIYRWDYADYAVFFENNYVLHAVITGD